MSVLPLVLLLGVNLALWTLIGGVRVVFDRWTGYVRRHGHDRKELVPGNVAVLIPAHNEAPVIAAAIRSALRLVAITQIHVVADGCSDATAKIARATGAHVLELNPGRGKAGGIEAALEHFDIASRFEVLLIVDADTALDEHYLERGLPLLDEPDVVALAGYAKSSWHPHGVAPVGRILLSYRARLYMVMQWLKFGQTWRWANVTTIVPGFASMYRTRVLPDMDLNPPGLVIEDFNMTFEIHRKHLGKIAFRPAVFATTQDPVTLGDYYRQVARWHLGFWQTLRRHGFWVSGFSVALLLFLVEVLLAAIGVVVVFAVYLCVLVIVIAAHGLSSLGWITVPGGVLMVHDTLTSIVVVLLILDYTLTATTALALRRPSLLLYGVAFLVLRFVDAIAGLRAIPQAWRTTSNGQWVSPARRAS